MELCFILPFCALGINCRWHQKFCKICGPLVFSLCYAVTHLMEVSNVGTVIFCPLGYTEIFVGNRRIEKYCLVSKHMNMAKLF